MRILCDPDDTCDSASCAFVEPAVRYRTKTCSLWEYLYENGGGSLPIACER